MTIPSRTTQTPATAVPFVQSPIAPLPGGPGSAGNAPLTIPTFPNLNDGGWTSYEVITPKVHAKKQRGKKASETQVQVGGPGTVIPVVYGRQRVGARVPTVVSYSGSLYIVCVWSEGPINAVEQIYVNGDPISAAFEVTSYLGTAEQDVDPWLVAAFAAQGITYSATHALVAYSVIKVRPQNNAGFPEFEAIVQGRKVATSEGGAPAYSTVPAYIIADLIENTTYGLGGSVNWDSVADVASRNNESVGGVARHRLNVVVDEVAKAEDWLLTLCDYASAVPVKLGGTWYLVPDAPAASEVTLTKANIVDRTLRYRRRGGYDAPTVVQCSYTDTSSSPWRNELASVYAPGVLSGDTVRIVQRISKPGITSHEEAVRYATQVLNGYQSSDLEVTFDTFDDALAWTPMTVVTLTAGPFVAKKFRLASVVPKGVKLFSVVAVEYDDARWSDSVVSGPTTADAEIDSPLSVPTPTGLAVVEDVYQTQTGRFASRLVITWAGPTTDDYLFLYGFSLTVSGGGTSTTWDLPQDAAEFTTPALPEGVLHTIFLVARSEYAVSEAAVTSIVNDGKLALPSDVPSITGYSVNGETRVAWENANDLDLTGYELRWSGQSGTWSAATPLTLIAAPANRHSTLAIPAGSRRVWIKALDSVRTNEFPNGQESANATYVDLEVLENNTSTSIDYTLALGTLTNMILQSSGGWITSFATDSWNALFTAAMSTYTNPIASYHASGTSGLVSGTVDGDASEACTVVVDGLLYEDLSGVGQVYIEHKVNSGDSWTRVNGTTASVTARYFRAGIEWTTTETGLVTALGTLRKIVDATDRFVKDTIGNDFMAWMN